MRFTIVDAESFVDVSGRSSLHAVNAKGTGLRGYIDATWRDGRLALDPEPKIHLEMPVDRINSGNALEDQQMRALIGSRSFPDIVADLTKIRALDGDASYGVTGAINVRGTTKPLDGVINVAHDGDRTVVEGEQAIDMRYFDITPPRILMLQVYPELTIRIHLVAEA